MIAFLLGEPRRIGPMPRSPALPFAPFPDHDNPGSVDAPMPPRQFEPYESGIGALVTARGRSLALICTRRAGSVPSEASAAATILVRWNASKRNGA